MVSTADLKTHLRILHDDEDAYIGALEDAAQKAIERYTGMALLTQTLRLTLERFPVARADYFSSEGFVGRSGGEITLPSPPVQSVTSIKYYNDANSLVTWSSDEWETDIYPDSPWVPQFYPTRVRPAYGYTWPVTYDRLDAVQITYVAGRKAAADIPQQLAQVVRLMVGDWFENREETVVGVGSNKIELGWVQRLLDPYRVNGIDYANTNYNY